MSLQRWLEWLVAAGSLFLLTGALDRALHSVGAAGTSLAPARAILIPFFAAALLLLARRGRDVAARTAPAWPVLFLVVLAAASSLWSTDPPITIRWVAGLVGTTVVGVFLAVRFGLEEQLEVLGAALVAAAVASAATVIFWPDIGTRAPARGFVWVGIFEDNNLFGRAMSLAVLVCLVLALQRRARFGAAASGMLCAVLLLGSRSLAPRIVIGASLIATAAAVRVRGQDRQIRRRTLALIALAVVLAAVLLAQAGGHIAALVGRDVSMSGRTKLWSEVLRMSGERLWFGHGYATFWPRAQAAADRLSLRPNAPPVRHPHNGFLELLFELGLVGVVTFLVPFFLLLWRALTSTTKGGVWLWPLVYLLFLAFSNVAESGLLRHKIFWALYVAVAVDLWGGHAEGRAERAGAIR